MNRSRSRIACGTLAGLLLVSATSSAQTLPSQVPPAPPAQKDSSDLTEGLLELLNEPAKANANATPAVPEPSTVERANRSENSSPGSRAGEDIGRGRSDPLFDVRSQMLTAAGLMRGQGQVAQACTLQREIVTRLDDLIGQLNQAAPRPNQAGGASADSTAAPNETSTTPRRAGSQSLGGQASAQGSSNSSQAAAASQAGQAGPGSAQGSAQSASGPAGAASDSNAGRPGPDDGQGQPGQSPLGDRKAIVDLSDPQALQRAAWGSLPDRVRQQMQSRMVERFLPGYREQIEAYYRALAK